MKFDFIPAKILNSESSLKILKILLRHNIRGSERSIAKLTGLSHMSVNRAMQEFGILNLVTLKKYGTSNNWEVNIHSYAYNMLKKLMPMIDFKDAALAHLKKTLKNGLKESKIKKAVLFGSIASGREKHDSDIDLFVLVEHKKDKAAMDKVMDKIADECQALYGNVLIPYVLDRKEYKNKNRKDLLEEIEKGIRII